MTGLHSQVDIAETHETAHAPAFPADDPAVVVIGAGVAGGLVATLLAERGHSVWLVDKRVFPRSKVCGGCLNPRGLQVLHDVGLSSLIDAACGPELNQFLLRRGSQTLRLALPGGRAIDRQTFDTALVATAVSRGARFLPGVRARIQAPADRVGSARVSFRPGSTGPLVELSTATEHRVIAPRAVVVAAGLGSEQLLPPGSFRVDLAPGNRIGCAVEFLATRNGQLGPQLEQSLTAAHTIEMLVHPRGYLGLVQLGRGHAHAAAAVDVDFVRDYGGLGPAIARIAASTGRSDSQRFVDAAWQGTLPLTRRVRPVAADGVFLVGDAAGYVEPFTGEGMSWGLRAAQLLVPAIERRIADDSVTSGPTSAESQWIRCYDVQIARRQAVCRGLRWGLRHPWLVSMGIELLTHCPQWGPAVVARIHE